MKSKRYFYVVCTTIMTTSCDKVIFYRQIEGGNIKDIVVYQTV